MPGRLGILARLVSAVTRVAKTTTSVEARNVSKSALRATQTISILSIHAHLDTKPDLFGDLVALEEVWAAAGTPNTVFCIKSVDLVRISNGKIISI